MATITAPISEQEYRDLALNDPERGWELWDGILVEKPPMSIPHTDVASYFGHLLQSQLDRREFRVHINGARTRSSPRTYFIPDIVVIPAALVLPYMKDPGALGAYAEPLPLVVEVWSRTTGGYDVAAKLPVYRERGDLEIMFLHPYERTLIAWRRQPDGTYAETLYRGGIVPVASLPGVTIDLDALLDG